MNVVLFSGGIDSTVCLWLAKTAMHSPALFAFSCDYGQRHIRELEAARVIARKAGALLIEAKVSGIPSTMLTNRNAELPSKSYAEIDGISPTFVPFRNGMMLAHAAAWLEGNSDDRMNAIYFGAHADDAHGGAYPDCTPQFVAAMSEAISLSSGGATQIRTPLIYKRKAEIIALGAEMHAPLADTWSCYAGGEYHCGTCPTCRARRDGFIAAGVDDPTVYQEEGEV